MNAPESNDPLSRTLATWQVSPPTQPGFRPAVWQRLQRRQDESWPAYLRAHRRSLLLAGACVVALSGVTGRGLAEARLAADRERMVVSYLVELDPRVMAGLPSPTP